MFKAAGMLLSKYKLIAITTLVIALLGTYGGMYWKIKSLQKTVDELQAGLAAAEIINVNNTNTIGQLEQNLVDNAAACDERIEAIRTTLAERDTTLAELDNLYNTSVDEVASCTASLSDYERRKRQAERERDRLRNELSNVRTIPLASASESETEVSTLAPITTETESPYYEESWYIKSYLDAVVPPAVSGLLKPIKAGGTNGSPSQ